MGMFPPCPNSKAHGPFSPPRGVAPWAAGYAYLPTTPQGVPARFEAGDNRK